MSVDGIPYAIDTRAPYTLVVDAAAFPTGWHELSFVATDAAGNASPPGRVRVRFARSSRSSGTAPAQILFRFPADGARVAGEVTIQASVSDSDGLAAVEWFVDGRSVFATAVTGQTSGVTYKWPTTLVAAGQHTITLIVTDSRGNHTTGELTLITR
jgi:hypothetical protein